MTEQQKKEITEATAIKCQEIWGGRYIDCSKIQLIVEADCGGRIIFRNDHTYFQVEKSIELGCIIYYDTLDKINKTLKVLGWVE